MRRVVILDHLDSFGGLSESCELKKNVYVCLSVYMSQTYVVHWFRITDQAFCESLYLSNYLSIPSCHGEKVFLLIFALLYTETLEDELTFL